MEMIPTAARTDHDDEAHKLAEEDGRQQEAEEADADGSGGIGQEPAADAHELQWFLESLEDRDAVEIDVHYLVFYCDIILHYILYLIEYSELKGVRLR
jgi:hypothetical protein